MKVEQGTWVEYQMPNGITSWAYGYESGFFQKHWMTWRMDGGQHAYSTTRWFDTEQEARDDLADRIRFYRSITQRGEQ